MTAHKTYKIRFHLNSPLSLNSPILHLDGILTTAMLHKKKKEDPFIKTNINQISNELVNLPIKFDKFYYASAAIYDMSRRYITNIYKKPVDNYHLWVNKDKANLQQGLHKTYIVQVSYLPISYVDFYVETDNIEELKELLTYLPGLGKYVNEGFGEIKGMEFEEVGGSAIIREGKTMRSLPVSYGILCRGKIMNVPYTPPYFKRTDEKCYLPFSEVIE